MSCVRKVQCAESVYQEINRIRSKSTHFDSNFYVGREGLEKWIQWDQLENFVTGDVFLLLRRNDYYKEVYYFADGNAALQTALQKLTSFEDRLNIDYVGKENAKQEVFLKAGFCYKMSLNRFSKIQDEDGVDAPIPYGEYASESDLQSIASVLNLTMDKDVDQIPQQCEILDYIHRKMAIVAKDDKTGNVAALILWTRVGKRMEFNYWALHPDYKGTLYALDLLNSFYIINGAVKRSTLFVRDNNIVPEIIHTSTGYKRDGVVDYVYCYRKKESG